MTTVIAVLFVEDPRDGEPLLEIVTDALEVEDTLEPETDDDVEFVASMVELDDKEVEPEVEALPVVADELPVEEETTEEADDDELTAELGLLAT